MKNEMMDRLKYAICGAYMMGDYDAEQIAKNTVKVLRDQFLIMHADLDNGDYYTTIEFLNEILKDDCNKIIEIPY